MNPQNKTSAHYFYYNLINRHSSIILMMYTVCNVESFMQPKLFWHFCQYLSERVFFRQREEYSKLIVHFFSPGKNTSRLVKGCTVTQCLTLISGHPVRNLSPLRDMPALCQFRLSPPTSCRSNVPEHVHCSQLLEPLTSSSVCPHCLHFYVNGFSN